MIFILLSSISLAQDERFWNEARRQMVAEEVEKSGISNPLVLNALRQTPRHRFVPHSQVKYSYFDMALPIGEGQTISPPFVVAKMTAALEPKPTDRVLEIGTGSGYQAAVLSHIVKDVYSIEIVPELGRTAARTIRRLRYKNVHTKIGDGFQGWAEHAPFDKIIVTCSPQKIPVPLVEQLREGGRMVIPLGERYQQTLFRFTKVDGKLKAEPLEPTFFVPMTGAAERLRDEADDSGLPRLVNGSFEAPGDEDIPDGWYYVRQAKVVEDSSAPDGERYLRFENETAGRNAQALQAVGLDGRRIKVVDLTATVRAEDVWRGRSLAELPSIQINFFNETRAPVGGARLGRWTGSFDWTKKLKRLPVPEECRLAVLAVGLNGAVGTFCIDRVSLDVVE